MPGYLKKNVSGSETVVEVGAITSGGVTAALGYTPANKAGESFTGAISVAGSITATGDVTAYSDASLKTDVATIAGALELVRQMRGVRYQRLDTGAAGIGVIAQELREVTPELVAENDDGLVFNAQEWIMIKNGSMVMASSIFKLPLDGSKTGAWGEFTGAAGSTSVSAGTLTGLTRGLTSATRTLTAGSVAATVAAGSTTFTKTSI
ncbi:tail fiber domain-containing protein [Porphyrobacter sp. AAP82]|uniref:tail fiber domain-containing protein n=1 Tax=Porphyrobacter sp. AAP82 TaxID=1248917 RepID=UPI0002FCE261|nr:tail fiber domain-containing protein [Porphyrobacter sp. AAP82]